jgi:hypothetical protein
MQQQDTILEVESSSHQTTRPTGDLILPFWAFRTVRKLISVLYKLPSLINGLKQDYNTNIGMEYFFNILESFDLNSQ